MECLTNEMLTVRVCVVNYDRGCLDSIADIMHPVPRPDAEAVGGAFISGEARPAAGGCHLPVDPVASVLLVLYVPSIPQGKLR